MPAAEATSIAEPAPSAPAPRSARGRRRLASILGLAALLLAVAASLAVGAREVPLADVIRALFGTEPYSFSELAVRERIPRTLLALAAGTALGVSGALMQAVTRNPLADPGILGVNTGAALFVVAGLTFFGISSLSQYVWLALLGAFFTAVFVYAVSSMGRGGSTPIKLALAGAATTAALSSLISALLLPRIDVMNTFRFWMVGGVGGAEWDSLLTIAPLLAVGLILGLVVTPALNALALGDEVAKGLGVRIGWLRLGAAMAGVMLCGAVTAVAGPIGFVGLMVPHAIRLITGPDQQWIVILSALYGAVLLAVADVLGRIVARPGELEVGIITVIIGAPVFIAIVRRYKVREL
ncbi:MAG: iron ABC transporter permease [Coriobacteriales bacterium]|nr:iron ABC transporter permease [Coriobacteriales bacterium]